ANRQAPAPWVVTARHVYGHYSGNYPDRTLREWAAHIRKWRRHGQTVFVSFDNDQKSAAPTDARKLNNLLAIAQHPNQGRINAPSASGQQADRRFRTLSRGLLIWQSRLPLAESMLHGHREGHQQRHGEECANGAPEPGAESDGKKHGEGIDLETPPH